MKPAKINDTHASASKRCAKLVEQRVKFGAPVSRQQIADVEQNASDHIERVKRSRKLKSELKQYATGAITRVELSADTRSMLQLVNESYRKSWSTKSAVILIALTTKK